MLNIPIKVVTVTNDKKGHLVQFNISPQKGKATHSLAMLKFYF